MKLNIVTPIHECDLNIFLNQIHTIKLLFENSKFTDWYWVIVIQCVDINSTKNKIQPHHSTNIKFIFIEYFSVSLARNIGIENSKFLDGTLYLLDCDALPTINTLDFFYDIFIRGYKIAAVKLKWGVPNIHPINNISLSYKCKGKIFSIFNSFLSCYMLDLDLINKNRIKFNENLGPGLNSKYKSGEDLIFLQDYLLHINTDIPFSQYDFVFHPKRDSLNTKQLIYSEGQIAVAKYLFNNHYGYKIKFSSLFYLFLLFLNSFKKIIFFENNSLKLLINRFRYLFGEQSIK